VVGAALPIPGVVVETEYATAYWHRYGANGNGKATSSDQESSVCDSVCFPKKQKQKKQRTTKEC